MYLNQNINIILLNKKDNFSFVTLINTKSNESIQIVQVYRTIKYSYSSVSQLRRHQSTSDKENSTGSINADELLKFQRLSKEWWQDNGEFEALHRYNELRVPWIKSTLFNMNKRSVVNGNDSSIYLKEPLLGLNILG